MKAVAQHADSRMVDKRRERRSLGNVVQKVAFPASKRLDRDIDAIAVADIAGKAQKIRQLPPRGGEGKALGHAPRAAAAEHGQPNAQRLRAGKRAVQIGANLRAVCHGARDEQRSGQKAVAAAQRNGQRRDRAPQCGIVCLRKRRQPMERTFNKIKACRCGDGRVLR